MIFTPQIGHSSFAFAMADAESENVKSGDCEHYQRKCSLVAPCCSKIYMCRLCHDEDQTHTLDRHTVAELVCHQCSTRQKVNEKCEKCGVIFGTYSCLSCRLFDDTDKGQFHCKACGICRVGGESNYFHCDKCGLCLLKSIRGTHKCIEKVSHSNCPVCLENLHTSRIPSHVPACGHLLHRTCFNEMVNKGVFSCPVCNKSIMDMQSVWELLDEEVASTPMPAEYKDYMIKILCRDCHKESRVQFHVVGHKCKDCGSYNTCQV